MDTTLAPAATVNLTIGPDAYVDHVDGAILAEVVATHRDGQTTRATLWVLEVNHLAGRYCVDASDERVMGDQTRTRHATFDAAFAHLVAFARHMALQYAPAD